MSQPTPKPKKGFQRKLWQSGLAFWAAITVMSLWVPFRIGLVQAMIRVGADRLFIGGEYRQLDRPTYVPGSEAKAYPPDAEVVGIQINGEARAIPLKRLAHYLIVNDVIGGERVTVAYCHVSDAVQVFRASCVRQKTLTFTPVRLARNNLVMRDLETRSEWQQFTGRSIGGPQKGCELERIPFERVSLGDWIKKHPAGRVLRPTGDSDDTVAPNETCPVMSYFPSQPFLLQAATAEDNRVPRKQHVAGVVLKDGEAAACADDQEDLVSRSSTPIMQTYWFAWVEFHPSTRYSQSCREIVP